MIAPLDKVTNSKAVALVWGDRMQSIYDRVSQYHCGLISFNTLEIYIDIENEKSASVQYSYCTRTNRLILDYAEGEPCVKLKPRFMSSY